jgi:prohibitin 2
MAQSKLNDLAGRFGKGPKGLGTGLKVLAGAAVAVYGVSQSMYTGTSCCLTTYY